ncbi:hypothetical protein [Oricola cellulosilytica]|uniref:Uncharacterized protein n=1 Tax=Oricola cellulosilytica TaxID=1429082 RepID=A0A4V2MNM2_9HYPH|nr:hypothetical protein [Oricola cellulosilytica]TCD13459.1 hypothetical protein E0D97_13345 [Oricola cellulosilytica]
MEPLVAVMMILGCDDAMMVCRQVPEPTPQYANIEACESDIDPRIRQIDGYPVAVAECFELPRETATTVSFDWRVDRVGNLYIEPRQNDSAEIAVRVEAAFADDA